MLFVVLLFAVCFSLVSGACPDGVLLDYHNLIFFVSMTKLERKVRSEKFANNKGQTRTTTDNNGRCCSHFGHLAILQPPFSSRGHTGKLAPAVALSETLAGIGAYWRKIPPIYATDAIICFRQGILIEQTIRHGFSL